MIIKKLLNKIEVNKYTVIMLFLALITGLMKEVTVIFCLLVVHELGHFLLAKYYNWNIKKVIFYPFGGLIIFDDKIDKPLLEEFIITISGPIFQIIFYLICLYLYNNYYISEYIFSLIKNYHYGILVFNLLPIVPLDGSKIFNILLNKFISFRKSYLTTIYISIILIVVVIIKTYNDTSYYILIGFLIYSVLTNIINRKYIYQRFILEKKLYKSEYVKHKKIKNIKNMYRNKKHIIFDKNTYITEKQMLNRRIK